MSPERSMSDDGERRPGNRMRPGLSRSEQMSRIRGKDTSPERILRAALWKRGLRYRVQWPTKIGRPDVVFPGPRVAVFVDGCFWHGCPEHYVRPRGNQLFWQTKLRENVERDRRQTLALEAEGWRVARIWEHLIFEDLRGILGTIEKMVLHRLEQPSTEWRVVRVEPLDPDGQLERRQLVDLRDETNTVTRDQPRSTKKWHLPFTPPDRVRPPPRTRRSQ